jgi:two-component system, LytTR family, sensor kinase
VIDPGREACLPAFFYDGGAEPGAGSRGGWCRKLAAWWALVLAAGNRCVTNSVNNHRLRYISWLWRGPYGVVKLQVLTAFFIITLLNTGYYWQRELRSLATWEHLQNIVGIWDGFEWYAWVLAAPATLLLIRRYPLARGRVSRNLTGLLGGSALIYLVVTNARYFLRLLPNLWLPDVRDLPINWPTYLHTQLTLLPIDLLTLTGLLASSFAIDYYEQYRRRTSEAHGLQLRTVKLQSQLARAQLSALQGQLQPHFLFNAFNAIATLVRQKRNETAVETISQLSMLLRLAMQDADREEIALEKELEFIRHYLAVEQVRFGEKLEVNYAVTTEALAALVPPLILQPIVGNSIKHAVSRRTSASTVTISARRHGDRLVLEVRDDGPGEAPEPPQVSTGIGLTNTRARLEAAYGDAYSFAMRERPEGGMLVRLELPWRLTSAAAEDTPSTHEDSYAHR